MSGPIRRPAAALHWFPHAAATEAAIIDMGNSRQIALRARLRNHYWLTECKPIGEETIVLIRRKMSMIDPKDEMTDPEVCEVLSDHYGFTTTPRGLAILDLDEARGVAVGSLLAIQLRASAGGKAKAAKAAAAGEAPGLNSGEVKNPNPRDF
jgi:hypothetical protein